MHMQENILILSKFERINYLLFPLKATGFLMISERTDINLLEFAFY